MKKTLRGGGMNNTRNGRRINPQGEESDVAAEDRTLRLNCSWRKEEFSFFVAELRREITQRLIMVIKEQFCNGKWISQRKRKETSTGERKSSDEPFKRIPPLFRYFSDNIELDQLLPTWNVIRLDAALPFCMLMTWLQRNIHNCTGGLTKITLRIFRYRIRTLCETFVSLWMRIELFQFQCTSSAVQDE